MRLVLSSTEACLIWGAQLEVGSTASTYIPTTTAPASSSTGDYWWQFDGTDSLALGSVPFQMADDHCVIAGAKHTEISAAKGDVFSMASTAAANPLFILGVNPSGYPQAFWRDDAGLNSNLNYAVSYVNSTAVFTARKVSNSKILRVDGVQRGVSTTALGATTFTGASIGARPTATTNNFMAGAIYPAIAIKGTVSDADLLTLEKWVGSLSGVTI